MVDKYYNNPFGMAANPWSPKFIYLKLKPWYILNLENRCKLALNALHFVMAELFFVICSFFFSPAGFSVRYKL